MTTTTTPALRAYHGDPAIKAALLAQLRAHAAADEIVKGQYWEDGKGCAVGCTIHSGDHAEYEPRYGIPAQLAHLEDAIFEALPNDDAMTWPMRFSEAIPVGADLSGAWPEFAAWLMDDPTYGVAFTTTDEVVKALCLEVAQRYRACDFDSPEAVTLADRLWAARDAWGAWAAWTARDARDARAARDAWAAWDAWDAWDVWAARDAFVLASATRLLALLAEAPVAPEWRVVEVYDAAQPEAQS